MQNPICPYCSYGLDIVPQRKKKCPKCGQYIYVRTRPSDRQRILVTEKAAREIDDEWAILNKTKDILTTVNVSDNEYQDAAKALATKFNATPKSEDVLWSILNNRLIAAMQNNDFQEMKMIYRNQALFLHSEGKDHFRLLQESLRCELKSYQSNGFTKEVEILTCGDSCDKCRLLHMKKFTIAQALEQMPIPVKSCNRGWCRCIYIPVIT